VSQPLVVVTERGHEHRQHDRPAPIYQTPREAKHLRNAGSASANTPAIKANKLPAVAHHCTAPVRQSLTHRAIIHVLNTCCHVFRSKKGYRRTTTQQTLHIMLNKHVPGTQTAGVCRIRKGKL
jgi:hypothetical protein